MILETLIGSENRERVLIFLKARGEGYAREIARFYDTDLFPIQDQLERLEAGGVLVRRPVGRTILYQSIPVISCWKNWKHCSKKQCIIIQKEIREELLMNRRRPRRRGKPE